MRKIPDTLRNQIISLRKSGKSIPEIVTRTKSPKTTVQRHVLGVKIPERFHKELRAKQGGAKERAKAIRENTLESAYNWLGTMTEREDIFLLVGLYWGEGTKKDFGIVNSDPKLIQTFICCLESIGIDKSRLAMSLRVHSDIYVPNAKEFWSKTTGLSSRSITAVEIIEGKKKGKLLYGMCRIRIKSGIKDRLFVQSLISLIGNDSDKKLLSKTRSRSLMDKTGVS